MGIFEIIGAIAMIVISIVIIGLVTIQDPKGDGLSALAGGGDSSFLNNNADRSIDATLGKITKFAAIAFFVVTLVVYVVAG